MLPKMLDSQKDRAYALLRIVAGFMFAMHGVGKVIGFPPGGMQDVGSQLWIGGLIELLCGTAIMIGLFTPYTAFVASGMMAVAYTQFHWQFQMDRYILPGVNKGEPALLYCFLFLFLACKGGGIWSVDSKMKHGE